MSVLRPGRRLAAVAGSYGSVRGWLAPSLGDAASLTHWEFNAALWEDGLDDAAVEACVALTEAYERARFAPASVGPEEVEAAREDAEAIIPSRTPRASATRRGSASASRACVLAPRRRGH